MNRHDMTFLNEDLSRRRFLKIMGASLALAGLGGCTRQPPEAIVPYVTQPENITPGKVKYYATTLTLGGYGRGALVRSDMGRPIKIEGNPKHPSSLGATDLFMQADLLTFYDPERSQNVFRRGGISTWEDFSSMIVQEMKSHPNGNGIRLLTGRIGSPTLLGQIAAWLQANPDARWHVHEPCDSAERAGTRLALGRELDPVYHFDRAGVIVSLDADFLGEGPGMVAYARQFIANRLVRGGRRQMNRLYCAEAMPSITGATADHRFALRPSEIEQATAQLAGAIGNAGAPEWIRAIAADLNAHRGSSIVIAGPRLSAEAHAMALAMNAALGNIGKTVTFIEPPATGLPVMPLLEEIDRGQVDVLVVLDSNPAYTLPREAELNRRIQKVRQSVHVGLYRDETAVVSQWHVPLQHELESWGDARAHDGTASLIQPLIDPLYGSRSALEILALLNGEPNGKPYEMVRDYWRLKLKAPNFDLQWATWLNEGVIAGSAPQPVAAAVAPNFQMPKIGGESGALELNLKLDPTIHDGRYANNAWLQECPKPITKIVWDNAAFMSPETAKSLGLKNEDIVEIKNGQGAVEAPVWTVPGHADHCVTLTLGYGRTWAGDVGNHAGTDAYPLRTFKRPWTAAGVSVTRTGRRRELACTQLHHQIEGRRLAREETLADFMSNPAREAPDELMNPGHAPSLLKKDQYEGNAWSMAIDLNACIGCNSCVLACQAENNVPVTGKEQVIRGREMHWLRIDYYMSGDEENPGTIFQPLACVHCEKAPCELVCPVGATVHDGDGLNLMVYNRCVGTRYCSNNCPYKVRRFNFLQYTEKRPESLKLMRNPDVTARNRGVMEKCTYCVQRIRRAHIEAHVNGDQNAGEVVTACQQACPTNAIVFGDLNDKNSEVAKLRTEPHGYALLGHLNTMPRTFYLARLRNLNPAMKGVKVNSKTRTKRT